MFIQTTQLCILSAKLHEMRYLFLFFMILFAGACADAQHILYSEPARNENRSMVFEILGRFGSRFLVYKNISRDHYVTLYDRDMKTEATQPLAFMPERAFNVDFICYPDFFYIIYQFQKSNVVYCYAAQVSDKGALVTEPRLLDTTQIGFFADNKIYSTTFSEDKNRILLFKRHVRNETMSLVAKLYDRQLSLLDSTRQHVPFNIRKETYSDLFVDNQGNYVFTHETRRHSGDNAGEMEVIVRKPRSDSFHIFDIPLNGRYIEEPLVKVDNLNGNYMINTFYYGSQKGVISGLFTAVVDVDEQVQARSTFNPFQPLTGDGGKSYSFSFDGILPRQIILRKNGGFLLVSEDYYTESLFDNNRWNRNDLYYPYTTTSDYFLYSPYYNSYRPWMGNYREQSTRFYYNDLLISSVDSVGQLEWNQVVRKRQYDVDQDQFLSYGLFNRGSEALLLYAERNNDRGLISMTGLNPQGELARYPTLKVPGKNYEFMPRLSRQVGSRLLMMPYLYLNKIAFALVEF